MESINFYLNNMEVTVEIEEGELLIDTLRNRLNIKSVKQGCGIGECGTCTVLLDNEPVYSCITLTKAIENQCITTIEGIDTDKIEKAIVFL